MDKTFLRKVKQSQSITQVLSKTDPSSTAAKTEADLSSSRLELARSSKAGMKACSRCQRVRLQSSLALLTTDMAKTDTLQSFLLMPL
jgi:hypothetical protein